MPYKNKKQQAEYMRKYRTPYMREYRQFKKRQFQEARKAINEGNFDLAKHIMNKKPSIDIWGNTNKAKKPKKKRKK